MITKSKIKNKLNEQEKKTYEFSVITYFQKAIKTKNPFHP